MAALLSTVAACLCSCQSLERSKGWDTVMTARIPGRGDQMQSEAYAQQMHEQLSGKGVENKLITLRYTTYGREQRVMTHGAVIYRNETTPEFPWWFVDNTRAAPLWLPNGTLEEQLRFATRLHDFEIVSVREGL